MIECVTIMFDGLCNIKGENTIRYTYVCVHNNNDDEVGSLKDRSDERLCKPVTQYVSYSFSSLETGVCSILPW